MAKAPNAALNNGDARQTVFDNLDLDAEALGAPELNNVEEDGENEYVNEGEQETPDSGQQEHEDDQGEEDDFTGFNLDPDEGVSHTREEPRREKLKFDKRGNVIDKDGKVLARAGSERRLYEAAHNARIDLVSAQSMAADLGNRLQQAVDLGTQAVTAYQNLQRQVQEREATFKQLGLNPTQQLEAMQMYREGIDNPTQLLKKLLTRAATRGIDLTQLGLQGGGNFDPQSLMQMIREEITKHVAPVQEATRRQQQAERSEQERQQLVQRNEQEIRSFFAQNRDLVKYLPVFERVMRDPRYRNMSLEAIGYRIKLNLLRQRENQQQNPSQRRSIPRGRQPVGTRGQQNDVPIAPVTESYDSIIKGALEKGGYQSPRE